MKYKYTGTEEQLIEHGFYLEGNEDYLRDVNDDIQVYVCMGWVYDKKVMNNYGEDKCVTPYIQDLIDANLVEVIK